MRSNRNYALGPLAGAFMLGATPVAAFEPTDTAPWTATLEVEGRELSGTMLEFVVERGDMLSRYCQTIESETTLSVGHCLAVVGVANDFTTARDFNHLRVGQKLWLLSVELATAIVAARETVTAAVVDERLAETLSGLREQLGLPKLETDLQAFDDVATAALRKAEENAVSIEAANTDLTELRTRLFDEAGNPRFVSGEELPAEVLSLLRQKGILDANGNLVITDEGAKQLLRGANLFDKDGTPLFATAAELSDLRKDLDSQSVWNYGLLTGFGLVLILLLGFVVYTRGAFSRLKQWIAKVDEKADDAQAAANEATHWISGQLLQGPIDFNEIDMLYRGEINILSPLTVNVGGKVMEVRISLKSTSGRLARMGVQSNRYVIEGLGGYGENIVDHPKSAEALECALRRKIVLLANQFGTTSAA